jgi:hypothetical protein
MPNKTKTKTITLLKTQAKHNRGGKILTYGYINLIIVSRKENLPS